MRVERVLVTGGAGFLGRAILRELSGSPATAGTFLKEIRVFDLEAFDVAGQPNLISLVGLQAPWALLFTNREYDLLLIIFRWSLHANRLRGNVQIHGASHGGGHHHENDQ